MKTIRSTESKKAKENKDDLLRQKHLIKEKGLEPASQLQVKYPEY